MILGVAAIWDKRKGLEDFVKLRKMLDNNYQIILVGLTSEQKASLPEGIIGITRTNNVNELRKLYAIADVFVNPTYEDNFPTTNIEALACGTPIITYQTGGSPEALDKMSGISILKGDISSVENAIQQVKGLSYVECIMRSCEFKKEDKALKYVELYK